MDGSQSEIAKSTVGSLFVCTVLSWALFGVLSVQVFLFSQAFPNDRPTFKAMVYGMYLLETVQTLVLTRSTWATIAMGFGHNESLSAFTTIWVVGCFLGGATAFVAQTFYAYRIMIISEKKILPLFIMLMSLTSFIAEVGVAVTFEQAEHSEAVQIMARRSSFIGTWIGTSCACDILIAACMCFYLSRGIRDGNVPKTQAIVSRAMRMSIETGALTASISVVSLAMYYTPPFGSLSYYPVPIAALSRLYSNAMLALLNGRMKLGIISESTTWKDNELPTVPLSHPRATDVIPEMTFASANTSTNEMAAESKDERIATDGA